MSCLPARLALYLGLGLALALSYACREDGHQPRPGRVERFGLAVEDSVDPERAKVELVERLVIDPEGQGWRILNTEYTLGASDELGDRRPALLLQGPKRARIQIPGEYTAGQFDALVLTMRSGARPMVSARLSHRSQVLAESAEFTIARDQLEILTVPLEVPAGAQASRLEIEVKQLREPAYIYDIVLTKTGKDALLPMPEQGPELFNVDGDARRAVGVSREAPLNLALSVPAGGRFSFDYAWPKIVQEPDAEGQVVVGVLGLDDGGKQDALHDRFPLTSDGAWQHVDFSLEQFAGQQVSVLIGIRANRDDLELAALISEPVLYVPDPDPQTVLLITSDTHRFDYVGRSNSGTGVQTPHLDALAERGVFFENCLSSTNVTLPSHVALMTGHSPRDTGVLQNNVPLAEAAPTLAEHFAAQGYQTLGVVAVEHLGDPESGLGQGFDRMAWPRGTADAADIVDQLLAWEPDFEGRSLFVWAHVFDAHGPYQPPDPAFVESYYRGDPRDPALPAPRFPQPARETGIRDIEYVYAQYKGEVTYLDRELGRLFETPRFAQGIIAFTADHGESFGAHDIWWTHAGLFPNTIHVPLIIAWPGSRPARDSREVRQIEVGRTLLDLARLDPSGFPGRSLVQGTQPDTPRFTISARAMDASVTIGKWHLILSLQAEPARGVPLHQVCLYDVVADPCGLQDLAQREPERTASMRALLIDWLLDTPDSEWAGESNTSEERMQALAELGYVLDAETSRDAFYDPECGCAECLVFRENE